MIKKPRQKFKYLENEKSFQDEIRGIFLLLKEANKRFFLEDESQALKGF